MRHDIAEYFSICVVHIRHMFSQNVYRVLIIYSYLFINKDVHIYEKLTQGNCVEISINEVL